ncbi:MAG: hypothetical protein K940chlam9_00994 [Chlamydiae bacterium]|nr:hypothetical protein [Chlamydiota bacterium]
MKLQKKTFVLFLLIAFLTICTATASIPSSSLTSEYEKYDQLADAIRNKKQVVLRYKGLKREVCPHTLGEKNGTKRVLVFQFVGQSKSGLPKEGNWRCLFLSKITILEVREGKWHTGKSHKKRQTCIDSIEVEVDYQE